MNVLLLISYEVFELWDVRKDIQVYSLSLPCLPLDQQHPKNRKTNVQLSENYLNSDSASCLYTAAMTVRTLTGAPESPVFPGFPAAPGIPGDPGGPCKETEKANKCQNMVPPGSKTIIVIVFT